jgi:hypothetical protein
LHLQAPVFSPVRFFYATLSDLQFPLLAAPPQLSFSAGVSACLA